MLLYLFKKGLNFRKVFQICVSYLMLKKEEKNQYLTILTTIGYDPRDGTLPNTLVVILFI